MRSCSGRVAHAGSLPLRNKSSVGVALPVAEEDAAVSPREGGAGVVIAAWGAPITSGAGGEDGGGLWLPCSLRSHTDSFPEGGEIAIRPGRNEEVDY